MEKQIVFDFVKNKLLNQGYSVENLSDETSLVDDLGIDSLDMLELVLFVEREFHILLTNDNIYQPTIFGDFITAVCTAIDNKN